jgi:opacity protein-like surface antigen
MRRKFVLSLVFVLIISTVVLAQSRQLVELSFAGSLQIFTDENQTQYLINIPVRAGFLATRNFEIESEFALTAPENGKVGYVLSGLLSYNFILPRSFKLFVLAGYGFTNSYPIITNNVVSGSEGLSLGVLNVGAGAKIPFGSKAALRAEYRFQNFTGKQDFGPSSFDVDFQIHSLFTGISLFLP